jgi:preprotein translocase subunit SecE
MSDENDDKPVIDTDGVDETAGADLQTSSGSDDQPTQLGAARYVFAAFFAGGLLVAYLSGMISASIWGALAEWKGATGAMPWLLQVAEDERTNYTMPLGAVIGIIVVILAYRKQRVRVFADDVATELTKVTWPTKDMVTTGTITVIVGVVIAAVYIGLLDQVWNFLTNLVYGA